MVDEVKGSSYSVLIVDDDPDHRQVVRDYLEVIGEFEVSVAGNVEDIWGKINENKFDLILLDYRMPDGTGIDAMEEMKDRGYRIPIIMITGEGDERVAVQAIQKGAYDYLMKSGDYLFTLPALIRKTVRAHELQLAVETGLEKIRYQAFLLDNVRDAIVVWDLEGKIMFMNPAAADFLGRSAEDYIGKQIQECYANAFPENHDVLLEGSENPETERKGINDQNEVFWVSSRITKMRDNTTDEVIGYMDVIRDITKRKEMEAQIQAAQSKLIQTARHTAIGELASGVAHQISNPLTTIIADAQIMLKDLSAEHPVRESAEAIEEAGWQAQAAVKRLMDFSRPPSISQESIHINQTIENAVLLIGGQIESIGVNLTLDLAGELPSVKGNSSQVEDLWVNLLLLARDATDDGEPHEIAIQTKVTDGDSVEICVRDDGKCIPEDALEMIFEPDFTGSRIGRGMGMELSICREIVRQHGGKITARSDASDGTRFIVTLPSEEVRR